MTKDLTKGNPLKLILLFTIPVLIGNIFQQLYSTADTLIVGRTIGVDALAAVGATGSLSFLLLGFAMGVSNGMGIVSARRFGENDMPALRRSFATGILLTAIISLVLSAVTVPLSRTMLIWLNTPAEILDGAHIYLAIILGGAIVSMFYNLFFNTMRAVGNSRIPLYFLIVACIINIILDYVIIIYTPLGVAGAAIATITSQLIAAILCLIYIFKKIPILKLSKQDFQNLSPDFKEVAGLSLPLGFQSSIIAIGALAVTYAINNLGADTVAGVTAAQRVEQFASLPMASFSMTMATFAAQNYGAGKIHRIDKGVRQSLVLATIYSIAAGIIFILFGGLFASAFLGDKPAISAIAHQFLTYYGCGYVFLSTLFVVRGTLQGMGRKGPTTMSGILELFMRCFAGIVLGHFFGANGVALAAPLAWFGGMLPLVFYYRKEMRVLLPRSKDGT